MACERFVKEGLAVYPMTAEQEAHLATCEDCRAMAQQFGRLERLIALSHREAMPPPGWEGRLEEVVVARARDKERRAVAGAVSRPWRRALVGGVVAAGVVGLLVVGAVVGGSGERGAPSVSAVVELPTGMRATTAAVGARYRIEVRRWHEARVWLNGRTLVARCPGGAGCEVDGTTLKLSIPLEVAGEYRVMVLRAGGESLAEPSSLDEDVRLVRHGGGAFEVLEPLLVQ